MKRSPQKYAALWAELVTEFSQGSESERDFCSRHGIKSRCTLAMAIDDQKLLFQQQIVGNKYTVIRERWVFLHKRTQRDTVGQV